MSDARMAGVFAALALAGAGLPYGAPVLRNRSKKKHHKLSKRARIAKNSRKKNRKT